LPDWRRAVSAAAVCATGYFWYSSIKSSGWRTFANLGVAVICTLASTLLSVTVFANAAAFAVVGAFVFAAAAVVAAAVAVVVAINLVGGFTAAGAFAFGGAFTAAVSVGVGVGVAHNWMSRRGLKGAFYILYLLLTMASLPFVVSRPDLFRVDEVTTSLLILLVFLPVTNSIFDWLSLAATRQLLSRLAGREDASALSVAWNALFGLVVGLLLLAVLAVTVTAGLQILNMISETRGGPGLLDVPGLLHLLRTDPANPAIWWIYFTLFSTMLPAVFHAAIASASFVAWRLPERWKTSWLNYIGSGKVEGDHRYLAGLAWR
jgi:hypothetical protein